MKKLFTAAVVSLLTTLCTSAWAAPKTVTLSVPGMTCAACPITIKKTLSCVDGVTAVDVSFDKKEATVTFDDQKATVDALTKATANAGFPSSPMEGSSK
ncbi:MAG: mercury resistance system periplasmic binding protein MerP [Acidobacteria bacterium]|nr:mercury resistance system periplasmic binding protein MerP [Acidobacteriota bacterium]